MVATNNPKPLLRGHFHEKAFYVALGACFLLVAQSSSNEMFAASLIYSLSLLLMLGVSALYHRPNWQPGPRALMKRLDHSAIFVVIAGSMTPFCILALPGEIGLQLLMVGWAAALLGITQSVFWPRAPTFLTVLLYVGTGWMAVPYIPDLQRSLGNINLALIVLGGVIYTIGALVYAFRRPALKPTVFGYHELFHVLTIVAAALHFIVIYQLIG